MLKFGLIIFIPNFLDTKNLGYYSYINTIVNISIIMFGMELWYFYNREIALLKGDERKATYSQQYISYILFYIIILPLVVFSLKDFDLEVIVKGCLLAVLSHWVQEVNRSLIYLLRLTEAAIINIVQSGWVLLFLFGNTFSIDQTLSSMIAALVICLILGMVFLPELTIFSNITLKAMRISAILKNIYNVKWYFVSSISMRLAIALPVLFYKNIDNIQDLAIFTYYFAIGTGIEFFLYHFVQAKFMGTLINLFSNNLLEYKKLKRQYFYQNGLVCIVLSLGAILFSVIILPIIVKNPVIIHGVWKGAVVICGIAMINFTNYYSIILYSQKKDIANILSPLIALPLSVLVAIGLAEINYSNSMLGYIYFLAFSLLISLSRICFWLKYDEQKNRNCVS